jgi:hypothetical protein
MAIKIPIFADYNDRGVKQAEASFSKFGRSVGNITKKAATAFAGIAVAAGAGAVKAIDMASNLAESQSKVAQIFGESGTAIQAFSKTAATSLGLSEQNVLDAAGTFGIFGKAAGLGGADLSDFSNNFTTLSSDLASFNNTSPEDAINAIGSALRGEMEPIRRYGVMLDDAAIKAEAMAQGLYSGKGALTAEAKTLATTALIYKKTSDAQGDFAKTSGGLANQTKIMKAQLTNAATTIGTALLPIAIKLASFFADKVIPAVEKLSEVFSKKGLTGVLDLAKKQLPKLKEAFTSLWKWITTVGVPKFVALMQSLGKALVDWIGPRIKPMLKKLGELIAQAANWIYTVGIPALVDRLIMLGDAFVAWITPLIGPMLKKLGELFKVVATWLVTVGAPAVVKAAVKLADALIRWVSKIAGPLLKGLGLLLIDIAKWVFTDGIPALAKLGVQLGAGLINALVGALKGIASMGLDVGKAFANGIIKFINTNVIDSINDLLEFKISAFGASLSINPPDLGHIPMLGNGGIVTRPTLAMIGEKGPEAVIPLSGKNAGMAGQGNNYITINTGANPTDVVAALQRYVRSNGPVPVNIRNM